MVEPTKNRIQAFKSPANFWQWLRENHASESELWLKIYKKGSGQATISWEEAVIEALCWGWIDGIKKSLDDEAYLQRFTPRRKRSHWSKRNREHVEKLLAVGRMEAAGLVHVRAAKADGRWDAAYAPASEMTMPEDFVTAVTHNPKAKATYATLNKTKLYAIAYHLSTARKPETRQRRFDKFLKMLKDGKTTF